MTERVIDYGNVKVKYREDTFNRSIGTGKMEYVYTENGFQWYTISEETVEALIKARAEFKQEA